MTRNGLSQNFSKYRIESEVFSFQTRFLIVDDLFQTRIVNIHYFVCLNVVNIFIDLLAMTFSEMKSQYSVKKFTSNKKMNSILLKCTSNRTQFMRQSLDTHHIFVRELFDNQVLSTKDNWWIVLVVLRAYDKRILSIM